MADCIDEGNDLIIDITGTVGLLVFGFEVVEFECCIWDDMLDGIKD